MEADREKKVNKRRERGVDRGDMRGRDREKVNEPKEWESSK